MNSKIYSATVNGVDAHLVEVEIYISDRSTHSFVIVGLADQAIRESRKRIKTALTNTVLDLPEYETMVNLAPAGLKKEGTLFDLAIGVGILQAHGIIKLSNKFIDETLFLGELSFEGTIKSIAGALSIAHSAHSLKKKRIILSRDNIVEACLIKDVEIIGVKDLQELINYLNKDITIKSSSINLQDYKPEIDTTGLDFADVRGQNTAKRALQIAAAGRHNILFSGPPGSGKTMLAQRLYTIMPNMSLDEIIETTKIYSVAQKLEGKSLIINRPFRNPHHSTYSSSLIGGGNNPKPGEVSLAHNGILFLDEFIEFRRDALEGLRQPLENKVVDICRVQNTVTYPANFLLIAAYNPCPCGFLGDKTKVCSCAPKEIEKYKNKISGPIFDRIDIKVDINAISYDEAQEPTTKDSVSSATLKQGVDKAVKIQQIRFGSLYRFNSSMNVHEVEKYCKCVPEAQALLKIAFDRMSMSMRTYHKTLKLARTIADLDECDSIEVKHIQQAIIYKS